MTLWFLSDPHFGHRNILTFRDHDDRLIRPGFDSIEEMDERIVDNWNRLVKPSDHGYILGDVAMGKKALQTVRRLNGHLRLVGGNHDILTVKDYREVGFEKIFGARSMGPQSARVIFTHIPIHPSSLSRWMGNAHGHLHERSSPEGAYLNLSAEQIDYTPVTLEQVTDRLRTKWLVGEILRV